MAIYHLSATPVQRSKGHSAVAGAAYRSGTVLRDVMTEQTHDYQRKRGIVQSEILAPDNAPAWTHDRQELWNRAELAEKRRDAQPAREIRLGLPHELTDEQRADLVFDYARDMFATSGMVADISIHRPDRYGDDRNHHAHILLTMRELDGDKISSRKNRDWNRTETLETWREEWANYQNAALEYYGHDARVDHRSLEMQGSSREPTRHLGKDAIAIEREGKRSRIGDENRAVSEHNRNLDGLENERAALDAEIASEVEKEFTRAEPVIGALGNKTDPAPEINPSFPTAPEMPTAQEPALTWEEQKAKAQSPFGYALGEEFKRDIEEYGEIREYGLGRNWYDRTVVMFDNLYNTTREVVRAIRDSWRQYIGNPPSPRGYGGQRREREEPDKGDIER